MAAAAMAGLTPAEGLRERKRARAKAAAVDAALDLFAERGYDQVTVADICAAAEIAPRTFFRYFPSKEAVLAQRPQEMADLVAAAIDRAAPELPDRAVLDAALAELADHVLAHRPRLEVLMRVLGDASARRSFPRSLLSEHERDLADHLARRRPDRPAADWPIRLLVAREYAAYRIWFDDVMAGRVADPRARLAEMLNQS
jgi:AcrR family transcriptional regulator